MTATTIPENHEPGPLLGLGSSDVLGAVSEAHQCCKCDGQGCYDQWKAVAGHYEGGEVFRMTCEHCDGTGLHD